jgi:adenosine deaminase
VYEKITDHKIDEIYKAGISLSVNTDTRTISDVTLDEEYQTLAKVFSWRKEELRKCNLQAIEHAFTTDAVKKKLRKTISQAYS